MSQRCKGRQLATNKSKAIHLSPRFSHEPLAYFKSSSELNALTGVSPASCLMYPCTSTAADLSIVTLATRLVAACSLCVLTLLPLTSRTVWYQHAVVAKMNEPTGRNSAAAYIATRNSDSSHQNQG
eukprot:1802498-Amphidinium_carterae.2